jgi:hypothetical protein
VQLLRHGRKLFGDIRQGILLSEGPNARYLCSFGWHHSLNSRFRLPQGLLEDVSVLDTLEPMLEEVAEVCLHYLDLIHCSQVAESESGPAETSVIPRND